MNKDKEDALKVQIMILSALKWIENPTPKVHKLTTSMFNAMTKEYAKFTGKYRVSKIGKNVFRTPIMRPDKKYETINLEVIDNWKQVREEIVPNGTKLYSSMSEVLQVLWDRISDNPYQERYCSDKRMQSVINAIDEACLAENLDIKLTEQEGANNSRKLANRFLELCGIKPRHDLATRLKIARGNLIAEGKEVVL